MSFSVRSEGVATGAVRTSPSPLAGEGRVRGRATQQAPNLSHAPSPARAHAGDLSREVLGV